MKGVILAGGLGTRLYPLTKVTNKHLLPVYDKPMIYYPIQILINAGIEDILIVTGGNSAGDFLRLLGNGKEFGLRHINYTYQEGEGGIAEALRLAEFFAAGEKVCVVLGDNLIEKNIRGATEAFRKQKGGPRPAQRGSRPSSIRCGRDERRSNRLHRGKTQGAQITVCHHRDLLLRCGCFRYYQNPQALRPGRARDYRCE